MLRLLQVAGYRAWEVGIHGFGRGRLNVGPRIVVRASQTVFDLTPEIGGSQLELQLKFGSTVLKF
jgi:hypothetical protein